jgi:DNA-binding IclR family transcriptional regulator
MIAMARVPDVPDDNSAQRSIQSIEVGFRLIRVLETATSALPLKTLAARAGMTPAKAHLYLVSFIRLGLVTQDPRNLHYGLGSYALQLGQAALRQVDMLALAHEPLESLQRTFELPTYLSIWGAGGPFSILKFDAELPTPVTIKVGFMFPLFGTATGRIFLAYLPDRITRRIAASEAAIHPEIAARREEIVGDVLKTGVAISEGYLFRGFSAISAPVFDHQEQLAAAVTMIGVATLMDRSPAGAMATAVSSAGALISKSLGYHGDASGRT